METKYGFESQFGENTEFYSVREDMFDLYGLLPAVDGEQFRRVPADVAAATSQSVADLSRHTAGGRVRFITNSPYVVIRVEMPSHSRMDHFALTGSSALDIYEKVGAKFIFKDSFRPPFDMTWGYESKSTFAYPAEREVLINLPTYSEVKELYIGVEAGSVVKPGSKYKYAKPVVYYGSSITQGACACRPGNAYEQIISCDLDCDYINLGFSGSAKAEPAIVDYICSLDMSVFVMDYDHNAPTAEYLLETHEPMFKKFRAAHPDVPVVIVSRPTFTNDVGISDVVATNERLTCREVVFRTYMNALKSGDRLVTFVDGGSLFNGPHYDLCTVDGVHPNDAGFFRMAERIGHAVGLYLK